MIGIYKVRVSLIGSNYTNTTSVVSTDLETKTFTLTPRNRSYSTTITGTVEMGKILDVSTFGLIPNSCYFGLSVGYGIPILDKSPEIKRQEIVCNGTRLLHLVFVQRIG